MVIIVYYYYVVCGESREEESVQDEGIIIIVIIRKASRHGVSAMPWPSTDGEMMKNVDNDVDGGEWGIVNIIIGESEKKERWEEPGSSNREKKWGKT